MPIEQTCPICLSQVTTGEFRCRCGAIYHSKCLKQWLSTINYVHCTCPKCNRQLTLTEMSHILDHKRMTTYLAILCEEPYNRYVNSQFANINRYKHITDLISRYPHVDKLLQLVHELEELRERYCHYRQWQKVSSECQSTFMDDEEEQPALETYTDRCMLFSFTSEEADETVGHTFLTFIIEHLPQFVIFSSSITIPTSCYPDVKLLLHKLKELPIYEEASVYTVAEIAIFKSERSVLNKYSELSSLQATLNRELMWPCSCGGRIYRSQLPEAVSMCDRCYHRYCSHCFQPLVANHICEHTDVDIILRTTKPCPSCGMRIEKSRDCDHMWCTRCRSGFDWRTGELIQHPFRNPYRDQQISDLDTLQQRSTSEVEQDRAYLLMNADSYPAIQELLTFSLAGEKAIARRMKQQEDKIIVRILKEMRTNNRMLQRNYYVMTEFKKQFILFTSAAREVAKTCIYSHQASTEMDKAIYEHLKTFAIQFRELITVLEISFTVYRALNNNDESFNSLRTFADRCMREYDADDNVTWFVNRG